MPSSIRRRVVNSWRAVKFLGFTLKALVRVWWGTTDDPRDHTCDICGYEGTAEKTVPALGLKIGLEAFDGEEVLMWFVEDDETLCYPCWHEARDRELPDYDPEASVERLRRIQRFKNE